MATKVKGDAIKEGSIPLSALSSEIKNKLGNDKYKKLDWYYNDDAGAYAAKSQTNKIIINEKEYDLTDDTVGIAINDKEYGFSYYDYGGYHVIAYGSEEEDVDILTNNVFILNESSSVTTSNWNAKEGEAGYIENKPFEETYILKVTSAGTYTYKGNGNYTYRVNWVNRNTPGNVEELKTDGSIITVNVFGPAGQRPVTIQYTGYNGTLVITDQYNVLDEEHYIMFGVSITQIPEYFVPDTFLKTTPQTLSNADKNQVKENLGISNPDWDAVKGEAGYIKNRTHGPLDITVLSKDGDTAYGILETQYIQWGDRIWPIKKGETVQISTGPNFSLTYSGSTITLNDPGNNAPHFEPIKVFVAPKILDDIYIPDTIARKSDIVAANTPNWNAQYGEAGYIENKPFNEPVHVVIPDTHQYTFHLAKEKTILYILCEDAEYALHPDVPYSYQLECIDSDHFFEFEWDGNGTLQITESLAEESLRGLIEITQEKGALNTNLIPNTVLKTTLQTLSDDAKNQALENLGLNIASQSEIDALFENGSGNDSGSNIS